MGAAHDDYEASFLSIPDFQAQCLELIERVADGRGEAVITRDGIAIARLVSAHGPHGRPAGLWKGLIEIKGDIVRPVRADWFGADRGRYEIVGDIVSPMPGEWFDESPTDPMREL